MGLRVDVTHCLLLVCAVVVVVLSIGIPSDASADVLIPASARVDGVGVSPGLKGFFYDRNDPPEVILTLAMADSIIASDPVAATFQATLVDYPNDPTDIAFLGTLGALLGADAVSLAPPSAADVDASPMVMRFTGFIQINPAFDTQPGNSTIDVVFSLGSDDGSRLRIGGQTVISIDPGAPITAFPGIADVTRFEAPGLYPIEIVWFDHFGGIGLEFSSSIPGGPQSGGPAGTVGIVPTSVLFQAADSGKVYTGGKPKGKAPNLIVLVHGCCTDKKDVKEWNDLGKIIKEAIRQSHTPRDWEIVVWDWHKDTPKDGDFWIPANASSAYVNAIGQGHNLSKVIIEHTYEYIHLIGHSAGAKLIQQAASDLVANNKTQQENPFIHLTFLDAFRPFPIFDDYGNLADYPEHYAEHYVDVNLGALFTNDYLPHAYNFDITNWADSKESAPLEFGHQWPRRWYTRSVEFPDRTGVFGFDLSLEGGNEEFCTLDQQFPPGDNCQLTNLASEALCGNIIPPTTCQ